MRFRLRTLLIVLTIAPPVLAWAWFYSPVFWMLAASFAGVVIAESLFQFLLLVDGQPHM